MNNDLYRRQLSALFGLTPAMQKDPKKQRAGRLGGQAGKGKAKARKITSAQARKAALARWAKEGK